MNLYLKIFKVFHILFSIFIYIISLEIIALSILMNHGFSQSDLYEFGFPLIYITLLLICFVLEIVLKYLKIHFEIKITYLTSVFLNLMPCGYLFLQFTFHFEFDVVKVIYWLLGAFYNITSIYTITVSIGTIYSMIKRKLHK